MKIILFLFIFLFSSAANAFLVTISYSWDSNPASEQITQYLCEYQINGDTFIPCSSNIAPPSNTHTESDIDAQSGDVIFAHVQACNVAGCSGFSIGADGIVPPNLVPGVPVNFKLLPMVIQ